ncbi:uncharacterized protein LOC143154522 isoform X3 [Ptiloglossa arizonensis]|uniref:uncharacterized protein LOC143154522 isoform X3 n=1 Tax=Ptiloglossa arizonensis TaxID=3350558 RepID=UPI003F9FB5DE
MLGTSMTLARLRLMFNVFTIFLIFKFRRYSQPLGQLSLIQMESVKCSFRHENAIPEGIFIAPGRSASLLQSRVVEVTESNRVA